MRAVEETQLELTLEQLRSAKSRSVADSVKRSPVVLYLWFNIDIQVIRATQFLPASPNDECKNKTRNAAAFLVDTHSDLRSDEITR